MSVNVLSLITRIISYIFVALVLFFVLSIIRLIYLDVATMRRKKTKAGDKAYLKLVDLRSLLPFSIAESYVLNQNNTIGRSVDCDICFSDETLSSRHARIFEEEDMFYIEDLGSKNGTMLNGEFISEEDMVELRDGDKISVGKVTFLFVEVRADREV